MGQAGFWDEQLCTGRVHHAAWVILAPGQQVVAVPSSLWGQEMSWGSRAGSLVHGFTAVSGVSAPALLPRPRALLPCAGSRDLGAD